MTETKTQKRGNAPRDRAADKEAVLGALAPGQPVQASSWRELRHRLKLTDMPMTPFKRTVCSLCYKDPQQVRLWRPYDGLGVYGGRSVQVVRI